MVRQTHHPEPSRRANLKSQYAMTKTFGILNFGHCYLIVIWDLVLGIFRRSQTACALISHTTLLLRLEDLALFSGCKSIDYKTQKSQAEHPEE